MTWPEDGKRMFEGAWPTCPREHGDGEAPEGCICTLSGAELMARVVELEVYAAEIRLLHAAATSGPSCRSCEYESTGLTIERAGVVYGLSECVKCGDVEVRPVYDKDDDDSGFIEDPEEDA